MRGFGKPEPLSYIYSIENLIKIKIINEYRVKVYCNRTEWYNLDGQLHREDVPAREWADGTKEWLLNGVLHRENDPAIESASGHKSWYLNGEELTEAEFNQRMNPFKELTIAEIGKLLKYKIKIIKG